MSGTRGVDYTLAPEDAAAQVAQARPDVVFLCAPNNPTGTPLGLDVIEAVHDATDGIVIVDEAFRVPRRAQALVDMGLDAVVS